MMIEDNHRDNDAQQEEAGKKKWWIKASLIIVFTIGILLAAIYLTNAVDLNNDIIHKSQTPEKGIISPVDAKEWDL